MFAGLIIPHRVDLTGRNHLLSSILLDRLVLAGVCPPAAPKKEAAVELLLKICQ